MPDAYSVIIPAYNAAQTIGDTLDSIAAQTVPPRTVIVVDDGSTDDTGDRARHFGGSLNIAVIVQANAGCGAATNTGLAVVATPFVGFLDADDVWHPDKAERQLRRLETDIRLAGLCARGQTFRGALASPTLGPVMDIWGRSSMMIRTDAAAAIGAIVDGGRGDMVDWIARGRELGFVIEMMPDILTMRRIRPDSMSYGRDPEKDRGYLQTVKRALDRRRQQRPSDGDPTS